MYSRFLDEIETASVDDDESELQSPSTSPTSSDAALRLQQLREAKQTPSFAEWYDQHKAEQEVEAARRATEFRAQMVEKLTSKFSEAGLLDHDVAKIVSEHQGDYWKVDGPCKNVVLVCLIFPLP